MWFTRTSYNIGTRRSVARMHKYNAQRTHTRTKKTMLLQPLPLHECDIRFECVCVYACVSVCVCFVCCLFFVLFFPSACTIQHSVYVVCCTRHTCITGWTQFGRMHGWKGHNESPSVLTDSNLLYYIWCVNDLLRYYLWVRAGFHSATAAKGAFGCMFFCSLFVVSQMDNLNWITCMKSCMPLAKYVMQAWFICLIYFCGPTQEGSFLLLLLMRLSMHLYNNKLLSRYYKFRIFYYKYVLNGIQKHEKLEAVCRCIGKMERFFHIFV